VRECTRPGVSGDRSVPRPELTASSGGCLVHALIQGLDSAGPAADAAGLCDGLSLFVDDDGAAAVAVVADYGVAPGHSKFLSFVLTTVGMMRD
jgi:hypothetical protein